ncbi:universal stress protein [Haloarchaeobius sp. TZWWS8]|uniref:universal stress protein n=1 Tax=Haloarchaeobius sp. TZWWS8 TaxID=3446121 RepID=UPI003EC04D62
MSDSLLTHALVPVANDDDAAETLDSLLPYLDQECRLTVVHVIEKAGGAPDKASVEQREEEAEVAFDHVRERCAEAGIDCETRLAYGTDVPETVFEVAEEINASSIVFVPRKGSRFIRFLTGDTALDIVTDSNRPVITLPGGDE